MFRDRSTASPSEEGWTLLYDSDCGFCKWIVSGVLAWDRRARVRPRALQSQRGRELLPDLSPEERLASVHLVSPAGERLSASAALAPLFRLLPGGGFLAWVASRFPLVTSRAYAWVASHRTQLSRVVPDRMKRCASAKVSRRERLGEDPGMRLPDTAHTARPWRIHELTRDFRLEDVWALPTPGGSDDFPELVQGFSSIDPTASSSRAARMLFAIRLRLGDLLGWDEADTGPGSGASTLRDRLPADLREASAGPESGELPFTALYMLEDEWAAEIVNRTVHGVIHLGWVPDGAGGYRGQMAVLVKPNGLLGAGYMAAIRPFRHLVVYPPLLRDIERRWAARESP